MTNARILLVACGLLAVCLTAWWLLRNNELEATQEGPFAAAPRPAPDLPRDGLPFPARPRDVPPPRAEARPEPSRSEDTSYWRAAEIEDFREALYELDIDSVDRLHLLEEFVSLGEIDTRSLWDTDWASADTFKRNADGFRLEETDDGALVFIPGEQIRHAYTFLENMSVYDYDPETGEFVHEIDYYGKPIQNIVKFLREDVMVFMIVSGRKVDLNLYQRSDEGLTGSQ